MCGSATDIAIKAMLNAQESEKIYFHGLMIATCIE